MAERISGMKTLTICGSMRFENQMRQIAWELEVNQGMNVLQCIYSESEEPVTEEQIKQLAAAHFRKIDLSDGIYVVDIGGYIVESVKAEIAYAEERGKEVLFHSQVSKGRTSAIKRADSVDVDMLAKLALLLWPEHTLEELNVEFEVLLQQNEAACFLAYAGDTAVGFAQCQLRHDYVEGTDSSPVGYLEGIFVREEYRHRGIARGLLSACEAWAREQGCTEFASDCELTNTESLKFHLNVGFEEANRIICFTKRL